MANLIIFISKNGPKKPYKSQNFRVLFHILRKIKNKKIEKLHIYSPKNKNMGCEY